MRGAVIDGGLSIGIPAVGVNPVEAPEHRHKLEVGGQVAARLRIPVVHPCNFGRREAIG